MSDNEDVFSTMSNNVGVKRARSEASINSAGPPSKYQGYSTYYFAPS